MIPRTKKEVIGYNCEVCKGKNFVESGGAILHLCEGFAEPVYEPPSPKGGKKLK